MRNSTFASILAGVGVTFSLFVPRAAQACWSCTTDSECPTGFTCDESVGCMPTVDCQEDSDCGAGMRCVTGTATECTGSNSNACHSVNACAPTWQAGCGSDADCGDGFSCVANGSICNGDECSTLSQCQAKSSDAVSCQQDSDCPSCWSCLDASESGDSCVNPGGPATGVNGTVNPGGPDIPADAGQSSSNGNGNGLTLGGPAKSDSSSSGSDPKVCRPPYWGLSVSYEGPAPDSSAAGAAANSCSNIRATRSAATNAVDPQSSPKGSQGGCSMSSTGSSNDGAPLFAVGAALAGLAIAARRKRVAAKS